jgi:hypothetical protein
VFLEKVDTLGLAVFVDREVGFGQAGNGNAVFLADNDIDENLASAGTEDGDVRGVGGNSGAGGFAELAAAVVEDAVCELLCAGDGSGVAGAT